MPLLEPIVGRDGTTMNEILVPKDTTVLLALRACNRSKAIWGDDVNEWKPERWMQPPPRLRWERARSWNLYEPVRLCMHLHS